MDGGTRLLPVNVPLEEAEERLRGMPVEESWSF